MELTHITAMFQCTTHGNMHIFSSSNTAMQLKKHKNAGPVSGPVGCFCSPLWLLPNVQHFSITNNGETTWCCCFCCFCGSSQVKTYLECQACTNWQITVVWGCGVYHQRVSLGTTKIVGVHHQRGFNGVTGYHPQSIKHRFVFHGWGPQRVVE